MISHRTKRTCYHLSFKLLLETEHVIIDILAWTIIISWSDFVRMDVCNLRHIHVGIYIEHVIIDILAKTITISSSEFVRMNVCIFKVAYYRDTLLCWFSSRNISSISTRVRLSSPDLTCLFIVQVKLLYSTSYPV